MNIAMLLSTPTMIFITFAGLQTMSLTTAAIGMAVTIVLYAVLLKVLRLWKKPTFSLTKGRLDNGEAGDEEMPFLQGFLNQDITVNSAEDYDRLLNAAIK